MSFRNLSPQQMFRAIAAEHTPECQFNGLSPEQFRTWKTETLPRVLDTIGDSPERVDTNPQLLAEWEHDGLIKQKWLIDVQKHLSATLLIARPGDLQDGEKRPAILCCHGHGTFGKEPVMGNDSSADLRANIEEHGYNYGHMMAKHGFVTYAIDWIGFGERNDSRQPNWTDITHGRDWCNIYYLHATMLGMTSLSINVTHGKAANDFASKQPWVDGDRLGVMGLSGGGTMALWMTLCDDRMKATEIICYSDLWEHFGIRDANYCGMQVSPGLYKLVDLPDLQGLIAPRPLMLTLGANDTCFKIDTAMACAQQTEKIFAAAGAGENFEIDLHKGPHGWPDNKSEAFFKKHLAL
jgi:hypothetical protein